MRDAKRYVGNLARVEGSICTFYLYREITYFCSHYFKSVSLLDNTTFRNDPRRDLDNEVQRTLSSGSRKDHWLTDKEYRFAHVHILINYNEVKPILE